ncbi:MAG: hypothetical protein LBI38_02805 [Oscillospiraceae bacterium]|jgi:hypothetical protein|nr:hypothetical protein [Oscillospiraceae bacterium]
MLDYKSPDDMTYAEILAEATAKLRALAPEWTDYNTHDPGVTFLEMLCWLTENQRYYLSRITEKHELKYLKLLGTAPISARPARLLAVCEPMGAKLPKGSKADVNGVPFTLEEDVNLGGKITVSREYGGAASDVYGFKPFGEKPRAGAEFYIALDEPLIGGEEYRLYAVTARDKTGGTPLRDGYYPTYEIEMAALCGGEWLPCEIRDGSYGFSQSGAIALISPLPCVALKCALIRCEADAPPVVEALCLSAVELVQKEYAAVPIRYEFRENPLCLDTPPLIAVKEDFRLFTEEEGGLTEWSQTDDLSCSGPFDRHYELDETEGTVRFGDNVRGKKPEKGVVIASMSLTAGSEGNVKENLDFTISGGGAEIKARNPFPLPPENAGANRETVSEAFERFVRESKKPYAAFTAADCLALIRRVPGLRIESANAYFPEEGKTRICVNPAHKSEKGLPPAYVRNIRKFLFERRAPCVELEITPPSYRTGDLFAEIRFEEWADGKEKEISLMLRRLADEAGKRFGVTVSLSKWKSEIEAAPYAREANGLTLKQRNGEIIGVFKDKTLSPDEILKVEKIFINGASYEERTSNDLYGM